MLKMNDKRNLSLTPPKIRQIAQNTSKNLLLDQSKSQYEQKSHKLKKIQFQFEEDHFNTQITQMTIRVLK